jgi:hypothetical protein
MAQYLNLKIGPNQIIRPVLLGEMVRNNQKTGFYAVFRCEEHLYKRLRPSVGRSVRLSPTMRLRGKLVTSRLLREEEEEEETDYVAIPLRRDSFAPRD